MDAINAEKHSAMLRYRLFRRLTLLLRLLELLALSLAALYCSTRLPSAAASTATFIRRLIPLLLGPRFLFLLGNAIVLTLFLRSRKNPSPPLPTATAKSDPDDLDHRISSAFAPPIIPPAEGVVFEDKNVCCVETPPATAACRRTRSEKIQAKSAPAAADLRRSNTDVSESRSEDAEEFRRTIEAFIEKQLRFQRQESMAIVCSGELSCPAGAPEADGIEV